MEHFFITLTFFGLAFIFMAVGVIVSNRRIKGSCGGVLLAEGGECPCGRSEPCEEGSKLA